MGIFNFLTLASVTTNSALTFFSLDVFNDMELAPRIWLFMAFQWILFGIQLVIQYFVDDIPEDVTQQIARTEYIVEKLIHKKHDEEATNVAKFFKEIKNSEMNESDNFIEEEKKEKVSCLHNFSVKFPDCIISKILINDRVKFSSTFNQDFQYNIGKFEYNIGLPPRNNNFS